MNHEYLNLTADVLEKVAAYVDAVESEKASAVVAEKVKVASALKQRCEELTGENLDDAVVQKLAASEPEILKFVEKLAGSAQAADSLGGPGDARSESAPSTKKEAVKQAEDQFAAWLSS